MNNPERAAPGSAVAVVPSSSRWAVLAGSAWHWDLQIALVVSAAVSVGLCVISIAPHWSWPIPLLVVSLWHAAVAVSEESGLDARLNGTKYGALVRVVDPTEIKFRAPYVITLWVAWAAVLCCTVAAALFAATDNTTLDIIVSSGSALLVVWAALCLVSLVRLNALHDDLAAEVDSMPEDEYRYLVGQGRSEDGPVAGERR